MKEHNKRYKAKQLIKPLLRQTKQPEIHYKLRIVYSATHGRIMIRAVYHVDQSGEQYLSELVRAAYNATT